jgi:hypothetical protein
LYGFPGILYNHHMAITSQDPEAQQAQARSIQSSVILAGGLLAVAGWSALIWLILNTLPTVPNRWMFFALLQIALTGTAIPVVAMLNRRFNRRKGAYVGAGVLIRQASWIGLFGTTCAWLRVPRLLSFPLALVLAVALFAIEGLLRLRERARRPPKEPKSDE